MLRVLARGINTLSSTTRWQSSGVVCSRFYSTNPEKSVMVTTPIFYVNGPPHIGHLYSALIADALTKWHKLTGKKTFLVTGTDEHGMKVYEAAQKKAVDVKQYCDHISDTFKVLFDRCNISYNAYIRTTSAPHATAVHALWTRLHSRGFLYEGSYEGWYCVPDEAFLTALQVKEGPNGKMVSIESGHPVEWVSEKNWMFKLSAFQKQLEEWIDSSGMDPRRANELKKGVLEPGLIDLSVSRPRSRIKWGIPVPNDDTQTIYVWLDALTNYLTATGYPNENYTQHWPADYHVIGKDIMRFHAIYWPAFLMAAGIEVPKNIIAHSHWTVNREKMSKSKGNVIDPHVYVDKYGVDPIRYFLLKEGGLMHDGDWSDSELETKYKAELADTLGNLFSRSTTPALYPSKQWPTVYIPSSSSDADGQFAQHMKLLPDTVAKHFNGANLQAGIVAIFELLHRANKYFFDRAPWTLVDKQKDPTTPAVQDPERAKQLNNILYLTIESLRISATLLQPIIPNTSAKMLDLLGVAPQARGVTEQGKFGYDYTATNTPMPGKVILFNKKL